MVLSETIWNLSLSSDKPDTVDLKIWLVTNYAMSSEGDLAYAFSSG